MSKLTLDEERRALLITEHAWSLKGEARQHYIKQACGENKSVAALVHELLETDVDNNFLNPSEKNTALAPLPSDYQNTVIGAYRVMHCLARGGMGDVYLAERTDGQFEKQVAIKFIRQDIDVDLEKRFAVERQVLARLQHPNIAQLLDSGATDNGKPYYVMEYIDGLPIDRYCQQQHLDSEAIIHLFIKVCQAICAAHRQLIIHRDLKPENILVTQEGEPKVLDFGVAKILHPDNQRQSTNKHTTIHPLTPRYASPEQLRQEVLGPATDIYSLGVILYELLTGISPYGIETPSPLELNRKILEHIPKYPTRAVRQLTTKNRTFITSLKQLHTIVNGKARLTSDIDAVLLKALEKDPQRRYASVDEFNRDLNHYSQKLPVTARTPSAWYRAARFSQRHKYGVAISLVATVVLIYAITSNYLGLKAMESQYLLLVSQQQQIEQQSQQMQDQRRELQQQEQALLEEQRRLAVAYQEVQNKNALLEQHQLRQLESEQQLTSLDKENDALKQKVETLAESTNQRINRLYNSTLQYYQLLNSQYWQSKEQAIATINQQQVDAERVFAGEPEKKAQLFLLLAELANRLDLHTQALDLIDKTLAIQNSPNKATAEIHARAYLLRANSLLRGYQIKASQSSLAEANRLIDQYSLPRALAIAAQLETMKLLTAQYQPEATQSVNTLKTFGANIETNTLLAAQYYQSLGEHYLLTKQIVPAAKALQTAVKMVDNYDKHDLAAKPTAFIRAQINDSLANLYYQSGDPRKATDEYQQALAQIKQHIGWESLSVIEIKLAYVNRLNEELQFKEAKALNDDLLSVMSTEQDSSQPLYWEALYQASRNQRAMGQYTAALEDIEQALVYADKAWPLRNKYLIQQGEILYALGRYQEALTSFASATLADNDPQTLFVKLVQSRSLAQMGDLNAANDLLNTLKNQLSQHGADDNGRFEYYRSQGLLYEILNQTKLARESYEIAMDAGEALFEHNNPALIELKLDLSRLMLLSQRTQSAKNLNKEIIDLNTAILPANHPYRIAALSNLSVIGTLTQSYGRKRAANDNFIQAMSYIDKTGVAPLANCYQYLVSDYNPKESNIFEYWFLQQEIFKALPLNRAAYDVENFPVVSLPYDYSNRARREMMDCFTSLTTDPQVSEQQRAVMAGYVGSLYLDDENLLPAKNNLEHAFNYFTQHYGATNPRSRYLAKLLKQAQY